MSVMGVWVVGVVVDDVVEEARRRFPHAAGAHGTWPGHLAGLSRWRERFGSSGWLDGTSEQSSQTDVIVRFADAVESVRNNDDGVDELQDYLLHAVPQQENEGMFCATLRKGDGAAALMWGLGLDATLRLPGCCGQFLFDAAQVRAALAAAEQELVLHPPRRAQVTAGIRLWLNKLADSPNQDLDELIDGPLRVLRHAERTGVGAAGLTLWY